MQTRSSKPRLIYRRDLLPFSQTVIREQGEALERLEAFYSGMRRATQMHLSPERTLTLSNGARFGGVRKAITNTLALNGGDVAIVIASSALCGNSLTAGQK